MKIAIKYQILLAVKDKDLHSYLNETESIFSPNYYSKRYVIDYFLNRARSYQLYSLERVYTSSFLTVFGVAYLYKNYEKSVTEYLTYFEHITRVNTDCEITFKELLSYIP